MGGTAALKPQTLEITAMHHCNQRQRPSFQAGCAVLLLGLSLGLTGQARATESSAAAAAVAKLLAQPLPGSEASGQTTETLSRPSVRVLRGETLDRVIRRTLPDQPFKDDFVRKAFLQLNASTLGKNPPRVLPAGTVLAVPTPQDLLTRLHEQSPAWANVQALQGPENAAQAAPATAKRRWVQFP